MAASKKKTRDSQAAHSAKPARKIAETKPRYATRQTKPAGQDSGIHLEFYIILPKQADVEKFVDDLTNLVEKTGGSVGGGTVVPET
jgi:hypothetical protein